MNLKRQYQVRRCDNHMLICRHQAHWESAFNRHLIKFSQTYMDAFQPLFHFSFCVDTNFLIYYYVDDDILEATAVLRCSNLAYKPTQRKQMKVHIKHWGIAWTKKRAGPDAVRTYNIADIKHTANPHSVCIKLCRA